MMQSVVRWQSEKIREMEAENARLALALLLTDRKEKYVSYAGGGVTRRTMYQSDLPVCAGLK
jgi:hypothetical protein